MSKIGIAIVGLGPAALPHSKSMLDLKDRAEVRYAVSRDPKRTTAYAQQFPFPVTNDINVALSDPKVDAVIVLTPPNAHLSVGQACFDAGKHVLVEKPLELTVAAGEKLVAAGRKSGKRLGVVLQHRFRLASLRLKTALLAGELGSLKAGFLNVPWWRPQSYYNEPGRGTKARDGGGVLLTQAVHALDLFRSLVGVKEVIAADVRQTGVNRLETEDYAAALLRLGNGAPGTLTATTAFNPGYPERIEIIGTLGTAALVGSSLKLSWMDGREETIASEGPTGSGANIMDFPHDYHRAVITDFLDALSEDRDPVVSGEEALATQQLIDAILAKGGWSNA